MQSDDRAARALAALARPREVFRSAVVAAIEELTAFLAAQRAPAAQRTEQEAIRLGSFAAGHFDVERFSRVLGTVEALEPSRLDALDHALRILKGFAAQGDDLHRVRVRRGADLRDTVRDALSARGRAFNTAHQIELLRTGRTATPVELEYGTLDFRHWNRTERTLAPPLVVEVSGADVQASALTEYLDGAQKVVLVIDGAVAPAPLARLIAPHTFVMQTTDPAGVARLAAFEGPGVVALMPTGAGVALFTYDPSAGAALAQRLVVEQQPDRPKRAVAGGSARQQAEELEWLAHLVRLATAAATAPAPAGGAAAAAEVTPADQLAGWLLRQADLTAVEQP
jgi:hypothetical protein